MNVYFDNAATTAIRKEVIDKMTSIMNEIYGNPSSTHSFGRKSKVYLENARKSIASILNQMSLDDAEQYLYQISQDDPELYTEVKSPVPNLNSLFLVLINVFL